jgi:1,4-alpha-glucan branching enzyme
METRTIDRKTARRPRVPVNKRIEEVEISRRVEEGTGRKERTGRQEIQIVVEFKIEAPDARSVAVAGNFNNWQPRQMPLNKNGVAWHATVSLPRGRYEYRFVVDGQWLSDPAAKESAPNPFGSQNSVLTL